MVSHASWKTEPWARCLALIGVTVHCVALCGGTCACMHTFVHACVRAYVLVCVRACVYAILSLACEPS